MIECPGILMVFTNEVPMRVALSCKFDPEKWGEDWGEEE